MESSDNVQKINFRDLIEKYDAFFFDCDGVLWEEENAIKGSQETLAELQRLGKEVIIVTNTTNSRANVREKIKRILEIDIDISKIYASSYLAALYLKQFADKVKKVYVIGRNGLVDELKLEGFEVLWANEHNELSMNSKNFVNLETDDEIGAVVCGFDSEINFYKICYASICLQKGALFVASNEDTNTKNGKYKMPAGGFIAKSLAHCSEITPYATGKPNPFPILHACETFKLDPRKCLMVGDSLKTDALLGYNANVDTCLLLTGVTTEENLKEFIAGKGIHKPLFYTADLSILAEKKTA